MFAYCGNNPVARKDENGEAFETVFDIISLGFSIADVVQNPRSFWAWAGLAGDIIDVAVPFVGGVGEAIKSVKAFDKAIDATDDIVEVQAKLHRPYIRKSVRETVEARTPRSIDGRFFDANTGLPIDGPYDLGHVYGHEFWRERDIAQRKGLTQKQFNDYMNDPQFYQIEDPRNNRSHRFEMRW